MKKLIITAIKFYQKTLSFDHGALKGLFPYGYCRFYPSCSEYTLEAVKEYGASRGLYYGLKRLCRCHPWHKGGYDPLK